MLHLDILREVFLSNANIFTERNCLDTTRLCSQVCHTWRSLILNSPTIWGRLLKLSALEQCSEHWREEVLNRSGNSLLWVYGRASGSLTHPRLGTEFFYRILSVYWERIEHLNIIITDPPIDEDLWQPLLKPAPFLQSFSVVPLGLRRVPIFSASNSNKPSTPLFSNHAPVLRKFCTHSFSFSLRSPWLADLRILHLFHPVSVSEILNALRSTPFLTTLAISGTEEFSLDSSSLPSVILANLTSLSFTDVWLPHVTQFITHIRPSNGCSLLCTSEFSSNVSEDLQALSRPLSSWFQSYLCNNHVTSIRFDLGSNRFWVFDKTAYPCTHKPVFSTFITPAMQPLPPESYDLFPSLFSNCDFSTVLQLDLTIPHLPPTNLPAFSPLFSSFSSVGSLSTDEQTLSTILSTPTPTPPENAETADRITAFFPHLHNLRMRVLKERHPEFDSDSGANTSHASVNVRPLLRFLRTRPTPIQTLDIGEISEWTNLDMTSLEEMTGLHVMWYTNDEYFNYTCGSGKPESLLFTATAVDF